MLNKTQRTLCALCCALCINACYSTNTPQLEAYLAANVRMYLPDVSDAQFAAISKKYGDSVQMLHWNVRPINNFAKFVDAHPNFQTWHVHDWSEVHRMQEHPHNKQAFEEFIKENGVIIHAPIGSFGLFKDITTNPFWNRQIKSCTNVYCMPDEIREFDYGILSWQPNSGFPHFRVQNFSDWLCIDGICSNNDKFIAPHLKRIMDPHKEIDIRNTDFSEISLSALEAVYRIRLLNNTHLRELTLSENKLRCDQIFIENNPVLDRLLLNINRSSSYISVDSNGISEITIIANQMIGTVKIQGNPNLRRISLTVSVFFGNIHIKNNPKLESLIINVHLTKHDPKIDLEMITSGYVSIRLKNNNNNLMLTLNGSDIKAGRYIPLIPFSQDVAIEREYADPILNSKLIELLRNKISWK